jgi:hypothetical protein
VIEPIRTFWSFKGRVAPVLDRRVAIEHSSVDFQLLFWSKKVCGVLQETTLSLMNSRIGFSATISSMKLVKALVI